MCMAHTAMLVITKGPHEQVWDSFVLKLKATSMKQKLELISDLMLKKAVAIAHHHEHVKQQLWQQSEHKEVS